MQTVLLVERCSGRKEIAVSQRLNFKPRDNFRSDVRPEVPRLAQSVFFFARHRQNYDDSDLKDVETASGKQGLQSEWRDCEDEFGIESSVKSFGQSTGDVSQAHL